MSVALHTDCRSVYPDGSVHHTDRNRRSLAGIEGKIEQVEQELLGPVMLAILVIQEPNFALEVLRLAVQPVIPDLSGTYREWFLPP